MKLYDKLLATRAQRAVVNIISTLALQFVTLVCGLVVPRVILGAFGSTVNGVVSSITQFLSYIALLESGVGGVIKAALYQPLAEKDNRKLSGILVATQDFFQKIAWIFMGYMLVLTLIFPAVTSSEFEWGYTASLILIIGVSTAAQYYFGITYQILLQSDQKLYLINGLQIVSVLVNAVLVVLLTQMGCSIHLVKLGSAVVFVLRPILIYGYVRRHYQLDQTVPADQNAIRQRWDGFGQHIAYFIHNNTDVVVLSMFSTMMEVSVYTVHLSIINGIKTVLNALSNGFAPAIGDMIAKKETDVLNRTVNTFECLCFILVSVFFSITALLIEPFVMLYTKGITDVNYFRPMFACLMCIAEGACVIRDVYSTVTLSAGHYRQTSRGAYLEAIINMVCSVLMVRQFGLVGVAIGTCAAMIYRTLDYVWYLSKHIVNRPVSLFLKRLLVNTAGVAASIATVDGLLTLRYDSWLLWVGNAVVVSITVVCCVLAVNFVFYRQDCLALAKKLKARCRKK